jgi:hypothetical protein
MKKLVIGLGMFVLVVAVLRRFGRPLGERAMEKCQEMLDRRMPKRANPSWHRTEPAAVPAGR